MDQGVGPKSAAQDESTEPAGAAYSELPPYIAFSTRDLPVEGKFETWRDFSLKVGEVDVVTNAPTTLEADIEAWSAGLLSITRLTVTESAYDRPKSFARNGDNEFRFTLCGPGMTVHSELAGTTTLKQGGGFLLSRDHVSTVAPAPNSPNVILGIDRAALLELMPRDFEVAVQAFAPGHKLLDLLGNMVPLIANKTEPTTREKRETIGRQIIDLVALLLNPSRDGRQLIEERGLKAARIGAVLKEIDRKFADPSLSPESLGAGLGISGRQVHRLLLETTKTFYEHLTERRLRHAHDMLLDPRCADLKIMDIAFQTGFSNASFFGQNYRRRFGDTPTGARATAAPGPAMKAEAANSDEPPVGD
ncbi:MAG: helix-turn-helix domain-containing protein [Hyphomicrobiales bacterium]